MCPACEREQIAYSSLLRRLETAHADPEAMQPRLIRSRLASACVPYFRLRDRLPMIP